MDEDHDSRDEHDQVDDSHKVSRSKHVEDDPEDQTYNS